MSKITLPSDHRDQVFHHIAADRADTGLIIQTLKGEVLWANPAYFRTMKMAPKDVLGKNPLNYAFVPEDRPSNEDIANFRYDPDNYEHETNVIRKNVRGDGVTILLHVTLSFYPSSEHATFAVLVAREVTEDVAREEKMRKTAARLKHIAAHDELTGVANRAELGRLLDQMLREAVLNGSRIGVMHVDLDKFKEINDTFGHSAGDAVLKVMADRLKNNVRKGDLVARVGGDEFVVVCANITTLAELQNVGNGLINAVIDPIPWDDKSLTCGISIGAALSDEEVHTVEEMLAKSDFALYDAKRSGRGRIAQYNKKLHARFSLETELATDLRAAVYDKLLSFRFQPIVGAMEGDIRAFETLVRWDHPKYGMLSPASFLPIAEHLGIMADIDYLAIEAALDLKTLANSAGHTAIRMSINASPELLSHPDFITRLCLALDRRGLDRASIIIEVLESVAFDKKDNQSGYAMVLQQLSESGMFVVLDDFGSGNAGLAQLPKLNVAGLKTDISLIEDLLTDRSTEIVFTALIKLCLDLNLFVTAEGIETEEQAMRVADIGAATMQGYWFARPLPQEEVIPWLKANAKPSMQMNSQDPSLRSNRL